MIKILLVICINPFEPEIILANQFEHSIIIMMFNFQVPSRMDLVGL